MGRPLGLLIWISHGNLFLSLATKKALQSAFFVYFLPPPLGGLLPRPPPDGLPDLLGQFGLLLMLTPRFFERGSPLLKSLLDFNALSNKLFPTLIAAKENAPHEGRFPIHQASVWGRKMRKISLGFKL